VFKESPLEKASQDKNSKQKERRRLNFPKNLLKVSLIYLTRVFCTKKWTSFIVFMKV